MKPTIQRQSSTEDLIIALGLYHHMFQNKRKKQRRAPLVWVNPYLKKRRSKGRFIRDYEDMRTNPATFKENFHVNIEMFDKLLQLIQEKLTPKKQARKSDLISAAEKLCITLEFLACGTLQRHVGSVYRVSKQRVGPIIDQTCDALYNALKSDHIMKMSKENWIDVANQYNAKFNFPNCIGAVDGKHVAIKSPSNAASLFYCYKGYHSVVLMALADANYRFLYIDIGAYGSEGDSTVFRSSTLGKGLFNDTLNLPSEACLYGKSMPFYFVGDDAFPLHRNLLKPFAPPRGGSLTNDERIFNYRLSRARRCIENAFGILCARWICLARLLYVNPDRAQKIIAACCLLHNFLITSGDDYCPVGFSDSYNEDGELVFGNWRTLLGNNSLCHSKLSVQHQGKQTKSAKEVREHVKCYVNSDVGCLSWQKQTVFL